MQDAPDQNSPNPRTPLLHQNQPSNLYLDHNRPNALTNNTHRHSLRQTMRRPKTGPDDVKQDTKSGKRSLSGQNWRLFQNLDLDLESENLNLSTSKPKFQNPKSRNSKLSRPKTKTDLHPTSTHSKTYFPTSQPLRRALSPI
jgi:hypothetical protein